MVQRELGAAGRFPWFTNGTPALDRLASEGIRFRNAFVVQSVCSPSRAAMLTGVIAYPIARWYKSRGTQDRTWRIEGGRPVSNDGRVVGEHGVERNGADA